MNRAILIGRVGRDAEIKKFESGSVKMTFTLATSEYRKDKDGNRVEDTEWHSVQMWGERAEKVAQYITKGKMLCVEGKISAGRYEDDGGVKFSPFIRAESVEFLSSKNDDTQQRREAVAEQIDKWRSEMPFEVSKQSFKRPGAQEAQETDSDDLPF